MQFHPEFALIFLAGNREGVTDFVAQVGTNIGFLPFVQDDGPRYSFQTGRPVPARRSMRLRTDVFAADLRRRRCLFAVDASN